MALNLKLLEKALLIGSTLVEGSTLTELEATQILQGKTVQGHPIQEVRELLNYRAAVQWLIEKLSLDPHISIDLILGFHAYLFQGFAGTHGKFKNAQNYIFLSDGTRQNYADPSEVADKMLNWVHRFNAKSELDPIVTISKLYYDFQMIYPFEDGNGRIGRIFCAYWLNWHHKVDLHFYLKDKLAHLQALEAANRGDISLLVKFFRKCT